jgi:hypothetical protein
MNVVVYACGGRIMKSVEIVHVFLIFIGAIIMLSGIIRAKEIMEYVQFVPEKHQRHLRLNLLLHRALMVFFFIGYFVVLASYLFHFHILSETFVSLIFLFGGVYVFVGNSVKTSLLRGVKTTLNGILPICCSCKKIRTADGDPKDQKAWKMIEEYISQQSDVAFTHGFCPMCFDEEMTKIDKG